MALEFSTPVRITSSRGNSVKPAIAADASGNVYVAFQDDRVRAGYPDIYVARFDGQSGAWQSSRFECDDTKIESYVTTATKPAAAVDIQGNLALLYEQTSDGESSKIGAAVYDGTLVTIEESVSAYYPMNDIGDNTRVRNKACFFDGPPSNPQRASVHGVASASTNTFTDYLAISDQISLMNPVDQTGFRLDRDNKWFRADTSILSESGGVDMWVRPLLASSDLQTKYFFGNSSITDLTANTISFAQDGGDLKLRIIDDDGIAHQTTVDSADYSWQANDWVHLRATWDRRGSDATRNTSVCFPRASTGYTCGHGGAIYKTTDFGATWSKQTSGVTYDLYSIDFTTDTSGWACGEHGVVLRTQDGGTNWQVIDTGVSNDLRSIVFTPGLTGVGYVCGTGGLIMKTTDSGNTWTNATLSPSTSGDFYGMAVMPGGADYKYVAVGASGQIYVSEDDSNSLDFTAVESGTTENLWSVSRAHPSYRTDSAGALPGLDPFTVPATAWTLYAVGDAGAFVKSTDKGSSWTSSEITNEVAGFYGVDCGDDQDEVYVCGTNGILLTSADGGTNWTDLGTSLQNANFYAIEASFAASGKIVAVGSVGTVMTSENAGIVQSYAVTKIGCLNIYINGKEVPQDREGDSEFTWDPQEEDLVYFGNFTNVGGGTQLTTVNATMASVIVYKRPPATGSYTFRQLRTFQNAQSLALISSEARKRIEFGDISSLVKTKSLWKNVKLFLCGAREPLQVYGWNAMLGMVDDVIYDLAIDKGNRLWLATENGVCSFDIGSANLDIERWLSGLPALQGPPDRFINYTGIADGLDVKRATSISVDDSNTVWVGTEDGLYSLTREETSFNDVSAVEDPVTVLRKKVDEEALNASQPSISFTKITTEDGLPSNNVLTVRALNGFIFVGTDAGLAVITKTLTAEADTEAESDEAEAEETPAEDAEETETGNQA